MQTRPARAATAAPGQLREVEVPAPSMPTGLREALVYLPAAMLADSSAPRRYPLLIFLHGGPGHDSDWIRYGHVDLLLDRLIARGGIPPVIALFPDGTGAGRLGRSLWIDSWNDSLRVETFVAHDLVDWAERALPIRWEASQHALIGISDGAAGALNIAFHHPDRFQACAGHSGDYELASGRGLEAVVGRGRVAQRVCALNSPAGYVGRIASRLRGMRIYFDCGLFDLAFMDDRALDHALRRANVPHIYREFWGFHTWASWRQRFEGALRAITPGFAVT